MLGLYYAPGACSFAAHIVLEESGESYEPIFVDFSKAEQRSPAYLKMNPLGRVPVLRLDSGETLPENTAILPYLGKRYGLWPEGDMGESRALAMIGLYAASVHPANSHISRPARFSDDPATHDALKAKGRETFYGFLQEIDGKLAGRDWLFDSYSVLDPYALTFYTWGLRHKMPMQDLKNYTAFRDRMMARPAVQRAVAREKIEV